MTRHRSQCEHKPGVIGRVGPGSSMLLAMLMLVALPAVGAAAVPAAAMVLEVTLRDAPRRDHHVENVIPEYECISSTLRAVAAALTTGDDFAAIANASPRLVITTPRRPADGATPRSGLLDLPPPTLL